MRTPPSDVNPYRQEPADPATGEPAFLAEREDGAGRILANSGVAPYRRSLRHSVPPFVAPALAPLRIDGRLCQWDAALAPHRIDGRLRRLSDSPSRGE